MKSLIKNLVIFSAGAALGCFAARKYDEIKFAEQVESDFNVAKGYFAKKLEDREETIRKLKEELNSNKPVEEVAEENSIPEVSVRNLREKAPVTDYTKNYISKDPKETLDYSEIYSKREPEFTKPLIAPYEISADEFEDIENTKVYLTMYNCGTIADDTEEIVSDAASKMGADILESFKESNIDEIYIRNPLLRVDFELTKVDRSYFEETGR